MSSFFLTLIFFKKVGSDLGGVAAKVIFVKNILSFTARLFGDVMVNVVVLFNPYFFLKVSIDLGCGCEANFCLKIY
jgi:hypothetical protein